ncbi:MAG TPA: hypothetical protein VFI53_16080, partial [Myxococcaceae bacterium]|nr:hypothetical protein [Myxococcaceae bacterium]
PNEEIFALVLRRWQSLPSELERARFFLAVLGDERFADLLPFMVEAALNRLEEKQAGRSRRAPSKISDAKARRIAEEFAAAVSEWEKKHPGASGLEDAQRAWRFAVGRTHTRTGADAKTIKRRYPDPLEKARDRGRALAQALRERSPRK